MLQGSIHIKVLQDCPMLKKHITDKKQLQLKTEQV